MIYQYLSIIPILLVPSVYALRCYQCPKTTAAGGQEANIRCLREGSEVTCGLGEDRCYTVLTGNSRNEVTKGCRRYRDCTQNIVCCQDDFCNAGLGLYPQTGYGKTCDSVADCVQGITDMRCDTVADDTAQKQCVCLDSSYNIGAACVPKKSLGEQCAVQNECRGTNTVCNGDMCVCQLGYKTVNGSETCLSDNASLLAVTPYSYMLSVFVFNIVLLYVC